ncbi:NAD(P)-binding domain protein [Moelleriella libera RCEF 2490]|uniref:NAD(P)-binding domain protein n=1 Tax=Moelleriella libera RCEF 2490 TaxID=1081109 RepID=A0A166NFQ6_9HYPO|nr:NAD(P)-binding domain protein [Moelleriella libera RCEF 2490]
MAPSSRLDSSAPPKQPSLFNLWSRQVTCKPKPVTNVSLVGKTAIVTGASHGVGLETCRQLLDLGLSRLIIVVANELVGRIAAVGLYQGRSPSKVDIDVWKMDLVCYDSIVAFVERTKTLDRMDIVILNATLVLEKNVVCKTTGRDLTLQINYLSNALLTLLLLPVAKDKRAAQDGEPSRITTISSELAFYSRFNEKNVVSLLAGLDSPGVYPIDRMMISKLYGQFLTAELGKQVPSSVAVINCVATGIICESPQRHRGAPGLKGKLAALLVRRLGYNPAVAARSVTDAAVNHGAASHGQYLSGQKVKP